MTLVLTYHRILTSQSAVGSFFDVTAQELDGHLRRARAVWKSGVAPDALLGGSSSDIASGCSGFIVTFDDGTEDHYTTAAPVLECNSVRGVFFVSTSLLGRPGYLTVAQCQELQARGHWIESHSHDHRRLSQFSIEEVRWQLGESRRILRGHGLGRCDFVAVPGGDFNIAIQQAAREEGYALLRTLAWGYNRRVFPFGVESITINRKTSGRWFGPLISARCEAVKKGIYGAKELLKSGRLKRLYFGMRDAGRV